MPSKKITAWLAGIVFSIFFIYFVSQPALVKEKQVKSLIQQISISAMQENWIEAEQLYSQYNQIWSRRKYVLQLNNGEEDYSSMEEANERLKGGIQSQDKNSVVRDCQVITSYWKNMNRIIPAP